MKTVQRFSFGIAFAIAANTAGISILNTSSVQAAIVTGTITGTWDYYVSGSFNLGDVFTAEYSYDDAAIVPYDLSNIDPSDPDVRNVGFNVPLSSLKVTVGSSYSHIFNFSDPSSSFSELVFQDFALLPPTHIPSFSSKIVGVVAHDGFGKADFNRFSAARYRDQEDGIPYPLFHSVDAGYASVDPSTGIYTSRGYGSSRGYNDVTFSPDLTATAVPTPALLPGLMGLGIGVLRKRRAEANERPVENQPEAP
jgi:hypothetical protein